VLEGALLEARAGNTDIARKFFKYLMSNVPWYGPIYFEAYRLEEKAGHFFTAMSIIRSGLDELPRYGPLWFGLLRLSERGDINDEIPRYVYSEQSNVYSLTCNDRWRQGLPPVLKRVREAAQKAVKNISKELVWKVYFEAAQAEVCADV
jgi:la-related protein 1